MILPLMRSPGTLLLTMSLALASPSLALARPRRSRASLVLVRVEGAPPTGVRRDALFAPAVPLGKVYHCATLPPLTFVPFRGAGDEHLEALRPTDPALLLSQQRRRTDGSTTGMALFAATSQFAANIPRPLRLFFDGQVNIAAAVFSEGGVGVGLGGHIQ